MKGDKKILVVAILLLLIAISYSTYAIYRTSVSGTAEVTAATWAVAFKEGQTTLTDNFTLTFGATECANNNHVADGKIAPGATCTKDITIDITGSEVDVAYTVTADDTNITAEKNSQTVSTAGANAFTASVTDSGNGTIAYNAQTKTATITVSLAWAGTDDDPTNTVNAADTALNGATISVPLTLVAYQVTTP